MSIIQDALKKAQGYIEAQKASQKSKAEQKIDSEKRMPARQAVVPQKRSFRPLPFLFGILTILVILAARQFLTTGHFKIKDLANLGVAKETSHQEVTYKSITPKATPDGQEKTPVASAQNPAEKKPPEPQSPKSFKLGQHHPNLILNGIMLLSDKPRAIINDAIVEEGDTVGGAKVVKINKNKVTLIYEDLEIILNLKR